MALNSKSTVEQLATDIARLTGETKIEAIRRALEERLERLMTSAGDRRRRFQMFFEREVWPTIPRKERGRRLSRKEEDALLGYGPDGV